jgi:CysZ protein
MLALTFWPMVIALALWIGAAWFYWDAWTGSLSALLTGTRIADWLPPDVAPRLIHYSALVLVFMLLMPVILITAVLLAAVIAMPIIVNFVAARHYPQLEKKHGATIAGSIVNALVAILVFAGLWIVTLPLWLTGILAPVLPLLLSAYLNQRLFRYDALAEHASAPEYRSIVQTSRGRMYVLGFALAVLYYVPLLNLLVPILSGLAFTYFCLGELARLRERQAVVRR